VAIQALTQTIIHLTQSGRFRQAADREKEIGQIYLQESNDLRKACESYVRAGDWYAQEDANAYVQFHWGHGLINMPIFKGLRMHAIKMPQIFTRN
jgi:hypothetical protein